MLLLALLLLQPAPDSARPPAKPLAGFAIGLGRLRTTYRADAFSFTANDLGGTVSGRVGLTITNRWAVNLEGTMLFHSFLDGFASALVGLSHRFQADGGIQLEAGVGVGSTFDWHKDDVVLVNRGPAVTRPPSFRLAAGSSGDGTDWMAEIGVGYAIPTKDRVQLTPRLVHLRQISPSGNGLRTSVFRLEVDLGWGRRPGGP